MNVLIIEDEELARDYLMDLIGKVGYDMKIVGSVDSVKNGIKWFLQHSEPDLVFMDIDLGDGLCFEIFEVIDVKSPVIFTTAYDQYAIQAFKVNSIDYLLKPVEKDELIRALDKLDRLSSNHEMRFAAIQNSWTQLTGSYKERFIIKIGAHLKILPVREIVYFMSREKATYAAKADGRMFPLEYSLDRLEDMMDPAIYFRINRKYIINYDSIKDMISYTNSRLKLTLYGSDDKDILVSRDRLNDFKKWLDR